MTISVSDPIAMAAVKTVDNRGREHRERVFTRGHLDRILDRKSRDADIRRMDVVFDKNLIELMMSGLL